MKLFLILLGSNELQRSGYLCDPNDQKSQDSSSVTEGNTDCVSNWLIGKSLLFQIFTNLSDDYTEKNCITL